MKAEEKKIDAQEGLQNILAEMGVGSKRTSKMSGKAVQNKSKEPTMAAMTETEIEPSSEPEVVPTSEIEDTDVAVDMSIEQYKERYVHPSPKGLENELKSTILVSKATLDLVRNCIFYLGLDTSINNYISNILLDHFREHRKLLNEIASQRDPSNFIPSDL